MGMLSNQINFSQRSQSLVFFLASFSSPFIGTNFTFASIWLAWHSVNVFLSQFVSVFAMSFTRIFSPKGSASMDIHFVRNSFQVRRIYTKRATAKMVTFKTFFQWLDKQLVNHIMRLSHLKVKSKLTISQFRTGSRPLPTWRTIVEKLSRNLNFAKNSGIKLAVNNCRVFHWHSLILPQLRGIN